MKGVFRGAAAFNQDLSDWNVNKVTHYSGTCTFAHQLHVDENVYSRYGKCKCYIEYCIKLLVRYYYDYRYQCIIIIIQNPLLQNFCPNHRCGDPFKLLQGDCFSHAKLDTGN